MAHVVIVGGGLSGLAAAIRLEEDDSIASYTILEANSVLGGRVRTDISDAATPFGTVEIGAAFYGPGQNRMLNLIHKFGFHTIPTYSAGGKGLVLTQRDAKKREGRFHRTAFDGFFPLHPWYVFLDCNNAMRTFERLVNTISAVNPHESPNAEALDRISLATFLRSICWTETAYKYMLMNYRTVMTNEPDVVSALGALWFTRCAGGVGALFQGETWMLEGGNSQIVDRLASLVRKGTIRLSCPVRSVRLRGKEAEVEISVGLGKCEVLKATHIIFAVPPQQVLRVAFDPPLPAARAQELQQMPMGHVIKTFCYYDEAFWQGKARAAVDRGDPPPQDEKQLLLLPPVYSGRIFQDEGAGTVSNDIFDVTHRDEHKDGAATSKPCILGFIGARDAAYWCTKTAEERKNALEAQYRAAFSPESGYVSDADYKRASTVVLFKEKTWADEPWVGGCYFGISRIGGLSAFHRNWRQPWCASGDSNHAVSPVVFFAGTEAANEWMGYMEGAIESGVRAAEGVIERVSGIQAVPSKLFLTSTPADREEPMSHVGLPWTDKEVLKVLRLPLLVTTLSVALGAFALKKILAHVKC